MDDGRGINRSCHQCRRVFRLPHSFRVGTDEKCKMRFELINIIGLRLFSRCYFLIKQELVLVYCDFVDSVRV